jgi:heme-degrading monooxygenase HmoA
MKKITIFTTVIFVFLTFVLSSCEKEEKGQYREETKQAQIETQIDDPKDEIVDQEAVIDNIDTDVANSSVIEIATFDLWEGIASEEFAPIDKAVEDEHVSKQPGFISRKTAVNGTTWLVLVHWDSLESAQASMDSFASAPAAADFMSNMNTETMAMSRYIINGDYNFAENDVSGIVEIAIFNLKEGVSDEEFFPLSQIVEDEHVSKQPGFISRDSAVEDGKWVVIVNWDSLESAQASMDSFASAPAAADFVDKIDLETMTVMTYDLNE